MPRRYLGLGNSGLTGYLYNLPKDVVPPSEGGPQCLKISVVPPRPDGVVTYRMPRRYLGLGKTYLRPYENLRKDVVPPSDGGPTGCLEPKERCWNNPCLIMIWARMTLNNLGLS